MDDLSHFKVKDGKNIALFGISGLYNFGCEAIVRGTVSIIRSIAPESKIVYFSRQARQDLLVINDLDIEVKQVQTKTGIFSRIINLCFRLIGLRWQIPFDDYELICKNSDVIISIGGDIYTIPRLTIQSSTYISRNRLVQFGEYAIRHGKKLVIWGASIGPYGIHSKNIDYYLTHFKKVDQIFCRESRSIHYLEKYDCKKNVSQFPDPAFFVEDRTISSLETMTECIAVNLSKISFDEYLGGTTTENLHNIVEVFCNIVDSTGKKIIFIPHVVTEKESSDNDLLFLQEIFDIIPNEYRRSISIYDGKKDFLSVKKVLRCCEMVIAARMHCAINALREGVPTILLSYSEKSLGMAEYIYGTNQWVIGMDELENRLQPLVTEMLLQRNLLSEAIKKRIKEILNFEDSAEALAVLEKILK